MLGTVEIPVWLLVLIVAFAAVTFASHFLFPSVRWFFRRRMEKAVAQLNTRLARPIVPFKVLERHDRIQQLLYDPQVLGAVLAHAREAQVPRNVAFELARRYAREIVPGFSASVYFGFSVRVARWLSRLLYRVEVKAQDDDGLSTLDPEATVVFVINHRSNMDYVLVTWLVSRRMTLSYAVGEWARIWPLSALIRAMGAYFIRRRTPDALYRKVLERYVQTATAEGVAQAIFPEGGLSLTGRVGPARLGLLSYILTEARKGSRPVVFVPVGLGYDRVLEDQILVTADAAGVRRFKARLSLVMLHVARMLWRRLWGRWNGFGQAAVSFGRPVPLAPLLEADPGLGPEALGVRLMAAVRAVVPVLPVPLVAAAVEDGMAEADLPDRVAALAGAARAAGAVLALPEGPIAPWVAAALAPLLARGMLRREGAGLRVANAPLLAFQAAPVQQILDAVAAKTPQGETAGT
ncbi:MAG: 1-acyl-sn-glycerol-3-phosphate acyltransferase [Gemmobacter sp.]|uniref:1-acyl-sn-glycerol-3-phosphate acyltransferase n=1 Tax=Gemmobacter sp. TaxID=1898957 RepID=UPI003919DBFF